MKISISMGAHKFLQAVFKLPKTGGVLSMESFLEYVEGQSAEDLTSSVLSYLLMQEEQRVFIKLFFLRLFPDYKLEELLFDVDIAFQASLGTLGRADILIESDRQLIIIENKFYAHFSQGDQVSRYVEYLQKNRKKRRATLVLLTPKERGKYYLSYLQDQLGVKMTIEEGTVLRKAQIPTGKGEIECVWLPWEVLLRDFNSGNPIVEQLEAFIKHRYLINTTFNQKELTIINGQDIPIMLEKLWGAVDKIKDSLSDTHIVKRTSQSRLFYGFTISESWGECWFGLYITAWKDFETPLELMIREEWLSESLDNRERFRSVLEKMGFEFHKELGYIYPIQIQSPDCVGDVVLEIEDCLASIKESINA